MRSVELQSVVKTWLEKVRENLEAEKAPTKSGFFGRLLEKRRAASGAEVGAAEGTDDHDFLLGYRLKRYRFGELLGVGTMGVVFAVTNLDEESGPALAIKVLPRPSGSEANETDDVLFSREVQIGQSLRHPCVVSTLETLETEPARFVVMERVTGGTLTGLLGSPMDTLRVGQIFGPLADGLQYAHEHGVVHRDLKPDNVMITEEGQIKILDFGLAQLQGSTEVTITGQFKGTPMYTSPEQIKSSRNVTPACDQFTFGYMMFEALSGQAPYDFDRKNPMDALFARLQRPAKRLTERSPEASPVLDEALAKMLSMEPEDRFESVSAAFQAVRSALPPD